MKSDILKQYAELRESLETERAQIKARLQKLDAVLGGGAVSAPVAVVAVKRGPGRPKGTASKSAAAKAVVVAAVKTAPAGKKRKMSPEGRAAIAAGARARWAKYNAAKAAKAGK